MTPEERETATLPKWATPCAECVNFQPVNDKQGECRRQTPDRQIVSIPTMQEQMVGGRVIQVPGLRVEIHSGWPRVEIKDGWCGQGVRVVLRENLAVPMVKPRSVGPPPFRTPDPCPVCGFINCACQPGDKRSG